MGPLGQALNGNGDSPGDLEPQPGSREDDQHGDQEQVLEVLELELLFKDLGLVVLLEGLGDHCHLAHKALGQVIVHHHHPDHDRGIVCGADRHDPPDDLALVPLPRRLDLGLLLSLQAPLHHGRVGRREDAVRDLRVDRVAELLEGGGEDLDGAEVVLGLLLTDESLQLVQVLLVQKLVFVDGAADLAGVVDGVQGGRLVVGLGHGQRLLQCGAHLDGEPALDALHDEQARDIEEEQGGQDGEAHKGHDQLGPELGAEEGLPALDEELHKIAQ